MLPQVVACLRYILVKKPKESGVWDMCRAVSPSQEATGDAGGDALQASRAVHGRGQLWMGSALCMWLGWRDAEAP